MNCDEFRARYLAGEDDATMRTHVTECRSCQGVRDNLTAARRTLDDPTIWEEPSPELEDRIVALIAGTPSRAVKPRRRQRWLSPTVAAAAIALLAGIYAIARPPTPDWEVVMPGTELSPLATSTVAGWNTGSGTRMVLSVEGLEPAPDGFVYEFWLSEGPVHISAGTFKAGGEIDVWSGVTRADFPRLWVTLEPLDDDESPSGQTVLDTGA
jgi:hypothetical protein